MSTNSVSIDTGAVSSEISRASAVNDNINSQYQAAQSHLSEIENAIETTSTKIQAELPKIEKKNAEIRALGGEIQEHQENIRLSSVQNTKLSAELNNFRMKLGETTQES